MDSAKEDKPKTRPPPEESWHWKDIQWKQLWRRQDHASLILTAVLIIAVAIVSFVVDPNDREYVIYDATLSYPATGKHGFSPTVPDWVAIIIPLCLMILTLIVGEFVHSTAEHRCVTDAVATMIYFILDAIGSLMCALLVTQASKVAVGMLRPDWLSRCQPANTANGSVVTLDIGMNNTSLYECTNTDEGVIKQGRQSFPSGHSTLSFNLASYSSAYLIWCWNLRRVWEPTNRGPMSEFLADCKNVLSKIWMLVMLCLAWGISMSRITDNQHSPADVVAGMVLGITIAIMYIMRAIPRYKRVLQCTVVARRNGRNESTMFPEDTNGGDTNGELEDIAVQS